MKQEDKRLLFKELCTRMPYGVVCNMSFLNSDATIDATLGFGALSHFRDDCINVTPYLRSMSSMTEEEREEYKKIAPGIVFTDGINLPHIPHVDWLNKKMFDYRGLIDKGLALEAKEGMYESKNKRNR